MLLAMESVCLGIGVLWAAVGALAALKQGRAFRERWGEIRRVTEARGDGAFRAAALTEARPRGVPARVWVAGILGYVFSYFGPAVGSPTLVLLAFQSASDPFFGRTGLSLFAAVAAVSMPAH